eukprot:CFRG2478T1
MSLETRVGTPLNVQHVFTRHTSLRPFYCSECDVLLRGVHNQCCACKSIFHQRCAEYTPNICPVILDASQFLKKKDWKERAIAKGLLLPRYFVKYPEIAAQCGFPDDSEHDFQSRTYLQPTSCTYCSKLLVGLYRQGYRCTRCHWSVHKSCRSKVPHNCVPCRQVGTEERNLSNADSGSQVKSKLTSHICMPTNVLSTGKRRTSRRVSRGDNRSSINRRIPMHVLYKMPVLDEIEGIGIILNEINDWEAELRVLASMGLAGNIILNCELLMQNNGDVMVVAKMLSAV